MGRPSKYDPDRMIPKMLELYKVGASQIEVCAALDISLDTLNKWAKDPNKAEFSEAKKQGEALSNAWWEAHGRVQLENKDFNSTLWYMNMKNRFGWRDKHDHTTNGKDMPTPILGGVTQNDDAE